MGKAKRNKKRGALAEDAAPECDAGVPPATGLCPCVVELKLGELQRHSPPGSMHGNTECRECGKTQDKERGRQKSRKGGRKEKGAKKGEEAPKAATEMPAVCMVCGVCACVSEKHCDKHSDTTASAKGKRAHTVYLLPSCEGALRGYCTACELSLAPRSPRDPTECEDEVGCWDRGIDTEGYLFDPDGDARDRFVQCSAYILREMGEVKGRTSAEVPQPREEGRGRGRRRGHGPCGWDAGRLSGAAKRAGLKGLPNIGNTCYFNAALQCLLATPGLHRISREQSGVSGGLGAALQAFLLRSYQNDGVGVSAQLRGLKAALERAAPQLRGFDQQDSQEALLCLFSCVELEWAARCGATLSTAAAQKYNPFWGLFGGQLGSVVRCGKCGERTETGEVSYTLSVPLLESVQAGVRRFFGVEPLGEGAYYCKRCNADAFEDAKRRKEEARLNKLRQVEQQQAEEGTVDLSALLDERGSDDEGEEEGEEEEEESSIGGETESPPPSTPPRATPSPPVERGVVEEESDHGIEPTSVYTSATRRYHLRRAPPMLVVHLQRFAFCERTFSFVKDSKAVRVPPLLEVVEEAEGRERPVRYTLCGVVDHRGGINSGHYTARVRREGSWFECDDSAVHEAAPPSESNTTAYMLFYATA
eukprot:Hpha_TRINITY_DN16450_c1_g2::TRINITY_DN16450_c1_g2_i2::g.163828::m.163828